MQTQPQTKSAWDDPKPTALLVLADGTVLEGTGFGATGHAVGEVCFNTAMTGYEEILTDPSYAGQIITFTFPHIGNVGTNDEDIETVNLAATPGARGIVLHAAITQPSNYRATAASRPLAETPRRHRACRHRHPRAHRAHPRQGHAERGDRA
jgi:carbamoyl-phosphate synthase small subunit